MTVKLAIFGQRDDGDRRATRGGPPGTETPMTDLLIDVEVVKAFDLSPAARARAESQPPVEESVEDDDVLEIEVEGGFQIWTSARQYRQDVLLLKPEAKIGDAVSVDTLPRPSERGVTEWAASRLRVLRLKRDTVAEVVSNPALWPLDLVQLAKDLGIDVAVKVPAWLATKVLIRTVEGRLKPGPGLYTWEDAVRDPGADIPTPVSFDGFNVDKPMLVFIHGTASSTRGSFNAFAGQDAQPQWQALRQLFDDRIYAFEHRTLSDSPIDNAIDLLQALPRNARVSIVSHSRGGLVGDLICLTSINTALLARFDRKDPQLVQADAHDRRQLERLAELIAEKQLRVERFVRCASPSRGTLLAGENIDIFLSVLTNLVGLIPGVGGTPLYEVTKRIALEIIRNRTVPSLVPGLEAMVPQSPLVALLNNVKTPAAGALGVIAGDIEGGNWLKRLGVFASDHIIYEARDNDLVVNTDAMFHGARHDLAGYVFDKAGDVSHFNYFRNPSTRAALVEWLAASDRPARFGEITAEEFEPVPMLRSMQTRAAADQPIVFVLPGIMGSHLNIGERGVWMHYLALLRGGLGDLADVKALNVQPVALVGDGYRKLCEYLQDSHEVLPFAYDWRRSVTDAARLLAVEVENALRRTRQPVRIVAHSMGGLVVRAMIAARPDLWDRICERDGGRLLMLGTPNRGSHDIVEALLGTSATVQQLALLDLAHDLSQIVGIVARFPGALELLPSTGEFFESSRWRRYRDQRRTSAVPDDSLLSAAHQTQDSLAGQLALFPHADRVQYVAGASPRTVIGVDIVEGRVVLDCTTEGDGRVTYESGRLPGVRTWYMDAVHGDLASHEPAFRALQEILETGATTSLSTTPPSTVRGGAATYRALPEPVLYPTESSLAAGLLGKAPRKPYVQAEKASFRISVVHGDLRYAQYPIVVGHYEGDTIIGAEKHVDELMRGALSQRYALGLYPGDFGSLAVILRQPTAVQKALHLPWGAIVIGLGKWGELSTGQLSDLLRRAALQYVLELRDGLAASDDEVTAKLGLSLLLIGGNSTANIAVGDSVGAILRAIAQANRELAGGHESAMTIQEVEIVELYTDTAIEAAHAAKRLAPLIGKELNTTIEAAQLLQPRRGGRRRLTSTTGRDAWRRWEVSVVAPPRKPQRPTLPKPLAERLKRAVLESDNADAELLAALADLAIGEPQQSSEEHREIRFLTLSDRARAEATSQQRQPELVERLIKDSIAQPRFRHEESRVLFELTVPNELKSGLAQVDNLVLVVDADSAAYPWELMSPGDKPLCITKALVRQLKTSSYRPQIGARAGTHAYIVGDPLVGPPYRQLPGAAAEAKAVYDRLRGRFDVDEPLTQPTALEVMAGLYNKPYRIVHLAGHGYYESPATAGGTARSGMVLDNGVFLTAVEVGQMQQVPELVFINCCHIGQTGPESPAPATPAVEFNRLAASVSRELIEMGVRAVVAAGWAVDDGAAKEFATEFYDQLLGGETFGRALKAARVHTYDMFPDSNTWGAYQAYGDPDYRLDPSGIAAIPTGLGSVDVAEFVEAVDDIGRDVEGGARKSSDVQTLGALVKACPTDWLDLTDVQMAIGYAYGRLKQFEEARGYLVGALAGEGDTSTTTMRAVEELANYEARLADDVAASQPERARSLYESATARLERLIAVAETAERHNLIGSALKRRAAAEQDARSARKLATRACDHYRRAHLLRLQCQGLDPYPALNWLTLATLLTDPVHDGDAILDRCEVTARERFSTDRKFFPAIALADTALIRALRSGRLGEEGPMADNEFAQIQARFKDVIDLAAPTASELSSVGKQIDVVAKLLQRIGPKNAHTRAAVARLLRLRRSIAGEERTEVTGSPDGVGVRSVIATNGQRRKPAGDGISA